MSPLDATSRTLPPALARELELHLNEIDRVFRGSPHRRAIRAKACRNFGDETGETRELAACALEAAAEKKMSGRDMDRLTMPSAMFLCRRGVEPN